jgi:acetolactate synthase small subunit
MIAHNEKWNTKQYVGCPRAYAEQRPGLLHLVSGIIERTLIRIHSCSMAATDIHDIVLISIEVSADESELTSLALKLENIIEVLSVEVKRYEETLCLRAAYFKMDRAFLDTPKVSVLNKYSAVIVGWYPKEFLAAKYGSDAVIRNLYNELDGPHLLGFSQTGLITDSDLIGEEQSSVIHRLAA